MELIMLTAVAPRLRAIFMSLAMVGTAWNGLLTATGAQESRSDVRWQSHTGLVDTVVFQPAGCHATVYDEVRRMHRMLGKKYASSFRMARDF